MNQLTKAMAIEWSPTIRVNSVSPGLTATDAMQEHTTDAFRQAYGKRVGMRRLGKPEEIAGAVVFLASDAAGFTTGTNLDVTGGAAPFQMG